MMTGVTLQGRETDVEETVEPVQYKVATPCCLRNVLTHARSKFSAVQPRYKSNLDREVSFCLVADAGKLVYVDRPPRPLSKAKKEETGHLNEDITNASRNLLPKSEDPYCVRTANELVVHTVRDGVTTSVNTDRVTKVPNGPRA